MIEQVTRVFVGSDTNVYYAFDKAIANGDLGELCTSSNGRVQFSKTNYPIEKHSQNFNASKMVVVARKPTETIRELADRKNLFDCEDRLSMVENYRSDFPEWWSKWVSN